MTIYEQMQTAVGYIEENLFKKITYNEVADHVCMSTRSFYNYFWCITGYTYKEYVVKRRLTEAVKILSASEKNILDVALDIGYASHEAFTRAFKNEFGISPLKFRKQCQVLNGLKQINLVKEIYMGIIMKELEKMKVACFEAFQPEPEKNASSKMKAWLKKNHLEDKPHRIFGHNIDLQGKLSFDPENAGYKFMVTIEDDNNIDPDTELEAIEAGRFIVTGIEGNIESDGKWIMEGWGRLNKMIQEGNYKVKKPMRWFEEELEPSKPGNLRLDLYLEVE